MPIELLNMQILIGSIAFRICDWRQVSKNIYHNDLFLVAKIFLNSLPSCGAHYGW